MAPLTMDTLPARPVAPAQPTQLQADVILAGEHRVTRGDPLALPGVERLRVVLRSDQGQPLAERELRIWHR